MGNSIGDLYHGLYHLIMNPRKLSEWGTWEYLHKQVVPVMSVERKAEWPPRGGKGEETQTGKDEIKSTSTSEDGPFSVLSRLLSSRRELTAASH